MVEEKACDVAAVDARAAREFDARAVRAAVEQLARATGIELSSEAPEDLLDAMAEALKTLSVALFGERLAAVRLGRLYSAALDGLPEQELPVGDDRSDLDDWDDFGGFAEDDGLGEGGGDAPIGFVLVSR
jgi:hypothetical protein